MSRREKRKFARKDFFFHQLVADYYESEVPLRAEFYRVTFLNISSVGAAFLSPRKPATDRVVLVLGRSQIYVLARVVRTFFLTDLSDTACNDMRYEVGCKFLQRLK